MANSLSLSDLPTELFGETGSRLDQIIKELKRTSFDSKIQYLQCVAGTYVLIPSVTLSPGDSIAFTVMVVTSTKNAFFFTWNTERGVNYQCYCGLDGIPNLRGWARYGGVFSLDGYKNLRSGHLPTGKKFTVTMKFDDTTYDPIPDLSDSNNVNMGTILKDQSATLCVGDKTITAFNKNWKFRLYEFWITDANGNQKLDLVPVRLGQNGYLYDVVSKKLYGNSGTEADFTLGPDIAS